ncbi:hypothetical protein SSX86_019113 [Deinandra increscens subsp. villosa]|uniref:Uncharacterized protein n=1 Tax=Deinandra increscens subsp. villosa TaxID=3103831 RepID=A0AAP0CZ58_9ASTR
MFRSPRSRNGRNKRSKIKPVIQISMLIGVSIWLLYQIHHSDDKKSSVTTKISQALNNDGSTNISKLGRKVLRPKVKATEEHHQVDDEQNDGKEGSEEAGEDHESGEHEEVGENEHSDDKEDKEDKEDNEEINETKQGEEIEERVNGNKSNKQENQVVVVEDMEKKKSADMKDVEMSDPSEDEDDNDDVDQSVRGEAENDKMMDNGEDDSEENDTSGGQRPSVDHYENDTKKQTAQLVNNAPDSYFYETNAANYMKSTTNDENTKADGESEEKDENTKADSESEEKDDVSLLEEKEALTDLETLPESRTGGSINLDNAATE